jgi:hypothetical protein
MPTKDKQKLREKQKRWYDSLTSAEKKEINRKKSERRKARQAEREANETEQEKQKRRTNRGTNIGETRAIPGVIRVVLAAYEQADEFERAELRGRNPDIDFTESETKC